ncbi:MAG: SH3 domain-containing protein [Christensenellaceae bacterium]|nr:SH3 domain-containing protein [Christensenellaceae bacterium]
MRTHRFVCVAMALVMAALLCLPVAHASEYGTQVVSAPMTYAVNARNGMVRVYLSSMGSPASLDITVSGSYSVSGGTSMNLTSGETVKISFNTANGQITMTRGGQSYAMGTEMVFRRHVTDGANGLKIAQARKPANLYPGDLRLIAQSTGSSYRLYPIVSVYIESYLQGVVPYEMGDSAHIEALKAQAVAARTYTLGKMNVRSGQLYDVVDTTNDQVYYGNSDSTLNCTAAVNATKGIVLQNSGQLTSTYYTASNGGQTESAKNFFNTSSYPYLTVKDDPFDRMNPNSVVKKVTVYADNTSSAQSSALKDILHNKAVSALAAMGYSTRAVQVTRIGSITPHTPKFASPSRLYTKMDFGLTVSTGYGTVDVSVTCDIFGELESALGMSINASQNELWSVEKSGSNFVIKAARFGHGVGMSQRGAMQMGSLGYTYDQILGFYYENSQRVQYTFTHTILSAIGTGDQTITDTDTPADITPPAGGYATVRLVGLQDQLAVRYTANASGAVLTTVANGGMVSVLAKGDAWTLVRLGRVVGYVPTAYLQFSGDVPTSSSEQPTAISRWATVAASGSLNLRASGSMSAQVLTQIPSGAVLCVFSTSGSWAEVQYGALSGWASTDFLQFSNAYPGEVRVSSATATVRTSSGGPVNLRQTASTSGGIVTTIAHGESVQVVSNDGSWCQVIYNGQQGYVMASYLDFGDGSSAPAPTDPPAAETPPTLGGNELEAIVRTVSGSLNLRQEPSTQAMILATIPRGESIVVTARGSEWSAVRFGSVSGYVMTQFLYFPSDDSQTVTSYAIVTTQSSALNMRSQPQTASSIVTTLPRGARVGVIEWRSDGWARVSYESYIGYASAAYLTPEGQASKPDDVPAGTTATVSTASGSLNLRQSPSTSSTVLRTIPRGATVELLQKGSEWCQVRYQGTSGYVAARYLSFGGTGGGDSTPQTPAETATVTTTSGGLNLRETASTDARVLASIPNGASVGVLERGDAWCRVQWNGQTGYVMTRYLSFASAPASRAAWIAGNVSGGVNLRQAPSYDAAVLATLPSGTALTQTGMDGQWCAVTWNGQSGYVLSTYITYTEPAPAEVTLYVSAVSGVNLRQGPSTDSAILMGLPRGAAVTATGTTGDWRQVTYGGIQGYVMAQYLTETPVQPMLAEEETVVVRLSESEPEITETEDEAEPVYDPTLVGVPGWHAQIAATSLNVRAWCDGNAPVLISLPEGTTVDLPEVGDEWCRIQYEGIDGYCKTVYLDLQPAMP